MNFTDSSEWMFGTGATFHVCPRRDWFARYEKLDGGVVVMGNDESCSTVGIGTIKIKMHDGVVRELNEVRHVPTLTKNLISLGTLEAKGFKVTM